MSTFVNGFKFAFNSLLLNPLFTTLRYIRTDLRFLQLVTENINQHLAKIYPKTRAIPLGSTALGTVAVVGTGTTALVGYGVGKVTQCFFQRMSPSYAAMAGGLALVGYFFSKLSSWATRQFDYLTGLYHFEFCDQKLPDFYLKRGEPLKFDYPYRDKMEEVARDFFYRELYFIYCFVTEVRPTKSFSDLKNSLNEATALLERHLRNRYQVPSELFHFSRQQRLQWLTEAKQELELDLAIDQDLLPPVETSSFIEKRNIPYALDPAKIHFKEDADGSGDPSYLRFVKHQFQLAYEKPAQEFFYRKIYEMYQRIGRGKPARNDLEFRERLNLAAKLVYRHLEKGLSENEKIVLLDRLDENIRANLLEKAKLELLIDLSLHLKSAPVYEEIVRRATPKERKALEEKLQSLPLISENIQILLEAIQQGDWDAEIFQNKDYPNYALEAVRRGQLSTEDYATVMIYWETTQMYPDAKQVKRVAIFDADGKVNEEAKKLIVATLYDRKPEKYLYQSPLLTPAQLDQLFEKLKKLPKIQQQIWIVPNGKEQIMEAIQTPILAQISDQEMMIAPLGLMQAVLDTAFGKDAVKLNPVHGLSSWGDIRQNHLDQKRDYAIRAPLIELPEEADGNKARGPYFGKHDFFHALLISTVPLAFRQKYVECYDIIQRLYPTIDPDKGSGFIDMDVPDFFRNFFQKNEFQENVFWSTLADLIFATTINEKGFEIVKQNGGVFPIVTPEFQEQNQKETARTRIEYAEKIAAHLRSSPVIENGAGEAYVKINDGKYSYFINDRDVLKILATRWIELLNVDGLLSMGS